MNFGYLCVRKSPSIALFQRGKLRGGKPFPYLKLCRIFAVNLLVSFACGYASAADLTKIYVGYGGIAGYQMPLWVNKEAEIGKKYGLEIEPLLISGGALGMQALLANSIQVSQNSASAAIGAALRGAQSR